MGALPLLAILAASPFVVARAKPLAHGYVEVDREVEFVPGDDPSFAERGPVPESRPALLARGTLLLPPADRVGWFRVELDVSQEMVSRGVHLLLFSAGAAELYVDGRLRATYGDVGAALRDERTDVTTRLRLDRAVLLDEPGPYFVAIRLAIAPSSDAYGFPPGVTLFAGDRDSVETYLEWRRSLDVVLIFFIGVALSLAVLHLLLFLFMGNRTYREFAFMAGALVLIPLTAFLSNDTRTMGGLRLMATMNKVGIVLTTTFGLRFYYAAFADRAPRWIKIFIGVGATLVLFAYYVPEAVVMVYAILALSEHLRIIIRAVLRKQSGAWIVGLGGTASVVTGIVQALDSLAIDSLSFVSGIPELLYLYGFLALLLSISVYLARSFALEERARLNSEIANVLLRSTQAQLVQSEKMAALGQLVAGIAHEINTPVGAISSMHQSQSKAVERLTAKLEGDDELSGMLRVLNEGNRVIGAASERVATLVKRLRAFARLDQAALKQVDIHEGMEDALLLLQHELLDRITVHRHFGEIPPVQCYSGQLNQVFLNLLVNAAQAIPERGEIHISTAIVDGALSVEIRDTGAGIAPENLTKVFDPGYTTKGVRVGTGLGLSICYQIIEQHSGEIRVESEVGRGSTFRVVIPMAQPATR